MICIAKPNAVTLTTCLAIVALLLIILTGFITREEKLTPQLFCQFEIWQFLPEPRMLLPRPPGGKGPSRLPSSPLPSSPVATTSSGTP